MREGLEFTGTQWAQGDAWFVYTFALADCSGFKIGFSCHPLQRLYTFSSRYFERFDLERSLLVQLGACDEARDLEAVLKVELAAFRTECPRWVPDEAGGYTEWFSAVYLGQAQDRLRASGESEELPAVSVFDFTCAALRRMSLSFESWAWSQARQLGMSSSGASRHGAARLLRDWLDAYRYFGIPLFPDDPAVSHFVMRAACGG